MNTLKKILITLTIFFSFSGVVYAQGFNADDFESTSGLGDTGEKTGHLASDLGGGADPEYIIGKIIKTILSLIGIAFLVLTLYGGFIWMKARGNEQEVEKAKQIIQNALIGLIIVLSAYAITYAFGWYLAFDVSS